MQKNNIPKADYHTHTYLCHHALGECFEYVEQALAAGLAIIGFSDHAPLLISHHPPYTMSSDELPVYHGLIQDVQRRYSNISIRLGIEADYFPGREEETRQMLAGYPYDYVIGSVHFINGWAFDDPDTRQRKLWEVKEVDNVYREYFRHLRLAAESGLYNIMGHIDLVKKFGHRPKSDLTDEIIQTAKTFRKTGVAIEINTSGLRKPVKEIYPSMDYLKICCGEKVPITFGSDAHDPKDVGRDFDKAVAWAKEAGYSEYLIFENGKGSTWTLPDLMDTRFS